MTVKQIAVVVLLLVVCASFAGAQTTTVKLESNLEGSNNIQLLTGGENWFLFAQSFNDGRGQVYAGPKYSPTSWLQLAASAGAEKGQDSVRFGGWARASQDRFSLLYAWSQGGSGPWHKATAAYQVNDDLMIGAIDRAFCGRGATAEYKFGSGSKATVEYYSGGTTVALSHSF